MKIENNKMISLIYELRENNADGRIIEVLDEQKPLNFIFGTGRLLPVFESNISTLSKGESFMFNLVPEMAYGERREEMIINVPLSVFETDGKLNNDICYVGNEVPMMDNDGNPLTGVINEITDEHVRMDFNHPMAGIGLFFTGKIIDVRDATEQELAGSAMSSCSGCSSDKHSGCSGGCS
jgi:FKBP-type peptidyl-prolyl cis-trans isomerase SlyD